MQIPKIHATYLDESKRRYEVILVTKTAGAALDTSETIVYQALFDERATYTAALDWFCEHFSQETKENDEPEFTLDPMVAAFLDATSYDEKLNLLSALHHRITQQIITTLAIACDVEVLDGDLEWRYQSLRNCLVTLQRYECKRLR
jgi:hypothetical protein